MHLHVCIRQPSEDEANADLQSADEADLQSVDEAYLQFDGSAEELFENYTECEIREALLMDAAATGESQLGQFSSSSENLVDSSLAEVFQNSSEYEIQQALLMDAAATGEGLVDGSAQSQLDAFLTIKEAEHEFQSKNCVIDVEDHVSAEDVAQLDASVVAAFGPAQMLNMSGLQLS